MPRGLIARQPVIDQEDDRVVGWVIWDEVGDFEAMGEHLVPAQFTLRFRESTVQPSLEIKFGVRDGVPVCTTVNITSKDGVREILPKDFEVLKRELNNWIELAISTVIRSSEGHAPGLLTDSAARRAYAAAKKSRRHVVDGHMLEEVAALYREFFNDGPWQVIADRYGVSEVTAGRYIGKARKAGLLPPTTPGKKKV